MLGITANKVQYPAASRAQLKPSASVSPTGKAASILKERQPITGERPKLLAATWGLVVDLASALLLYRH